MVTLAAASLATVSPDFVLDISHMGILSAMLDEITADGDTRREIARCIAEKNTHDLARICAEAGVGKTDTAALCDFVSIYGDMDTVLTRLAPLCRRYEAVSVAISELTALRDHLKKTPYAERVRFDFSIINDMSYYNGVVFCGYLDGICECVLSGGQYNKLMKRMGRKSGAIGFALYLDRLESLVSPRKEFDVDALLLYDENNTPAEILAAVKKLTDDGLCVLAQKSVPERLWYRQLLKLTESGVETIETNA